MVKSHSVPMANSSVPNHDFAPAWLKIPSPDTSLKNSSGESSNLNDGEHFSRKDDLFINDPKSEFLSSISRPRSHIFSNRHHSIDVDDSKFYFPDTLHRSGCSKRDLNSKRVGNSNYNSVPSLQRRPHSRHDFRSNEIHNNFHHTQSKNSKYGDGKTDSFFLGSPHLKSQSRSLDVDENEDHSEVRTKSKNEDFNHQFPSLGSVNGEFSMSGVCNGGVWDNAHNRVHQASKKIQLVQKPLKCENGEKVTSGLNNGNLKQNPHAAIVNQANKSNNQNQSSMYRAFVPSKVTSARKNPKDKKSSAFSKDSISNMKVISPPALIQESGTKEFGNMNNIVPHMEILVKNPRNLSDKKSKFLKNLKSPDEAKKMCPDSTVDEIARVNFESGDLKNQMSIGEIHVNGLDSLQINGVDSNGKDSILSSSLEAEQRLLREMGWKDEASGDEDTYAPLTEDELREIDHLSKKIAEQRLFHQSSLSPKKMIPSFVTNAIVPPIEDDDDGWSSSSSD